MTTTFCDDVVCHLTRLQGYARRLAGNRSLADDLVQETVLRALTHADQFRPGTNLLAWLMTPMLSRPSLWLFRLCVGIALLRTMRKLMWPR